MARGKKKVDTNTEEVLPMLIAYNPDIIENNSKTPNILIDNFVGVSVDDYNYELVKIKQITVTEDNIKTATNLYGDKYGIGDTYQEWCSMGKYFGSYENAVEFYSDLRFRYEVKKITYCSNNSELDKIRKETKATIEKFMTESIIPEVTHDLNNAAKELQSLKTEMQQLRKLKEEVIRECDSLISVVKEKRATMIAKGIIEQKKVNHRVEEE